MPWSLFGPLLSEMALKSKIIPARFDENHQFHQISELYFEELLHFEE
jgi:hypothetical protein